VDGLLCGCQSIYNLQFNSIQFNSVQCNNVRVHVLR
jgi:hypothetical protein